MHTVYQSLLNKDYSCFSEVIISEAELKQLATIIITDGSYGDKVSLPILEEALIYENNPNVIGEITKSIYGLSNPDRRKIIEIKKRTYKNENGMIVDESDKWYGDPTIYNTFSEAEDPENVCFALLQSKFKSKKIVNPIDIATGTGRMLWQIIEKIPYEGSLYAVDVSKDMCNFLEKVIKREKKYTKRIIVKNGPTKKLQQLLGIKSNFIISSFGFPSKISDTKNTYKELRAIEDALTDDGVFITIGWDESFNDELNHMWYKFVPDKIQANNFEEWRQKRCATIHSPRNCELSWYKKGLSVPLQFRSLTESAFVMGHLFGRDAAHYVIKNKQYEWEMSLGITVNTKKELSKIISTYEKRS